MAILAAAGVLALCSPPAWSNPIATVTYRGTATSIQDSTDFFGLAPGITEASYTDTFVFDLARGTHVTNQPWDQVYGGGAWNTSSPLLKSELTINGHTVVFSGGYGDEDYIQQGYLADAYADDYQPQNDFWALNYQIIFVNGPALLTTPFSVTGEGRGSFFVCRPISACGGTGYVAYGDFSPASIDVSFKDGVPEPAVWSMMLVGLAGLGGAIRSQRDRGRTAS